MMMLQSIGVLILILLEDTLWELYSFTTKDRCSIVLILILLEDTLWDERGLRLRERLRES